jgi:hypothetical protein
MSSEFIFLQSLPYLLPLISIVGFALFVFRWRKPGAGERTFALATYLNLSCSPLVIYLYMNQVISGIESAVIMGCVSEVLQVSVFVADQIQSCAVLSR